MTGLLFSEEYQRMLRKQHQGGHWGGAIKGKEGQVLDKAASWGCSNVLDYGCGNGYLKKYADAQNRLPVVEYDPGVFGKDTTPEPCDFTVCSDVMEHIETHLVDNVFDHIWSLTRVGGFFGICLVPSFSKFDDGRNLHLTIEPVSFWMAHIERRFQIETFNGTRSHLFCYYKKKGG